MKRRTLMIHMIKQNLRVFGENFVQTKAEAIYCDLKSRILSGELKADMRLKIRQLAISYESSDIPVREALKELAAEELIEMNPHRGSIVKRFSLKEMQNMLEVREVLEPLAAKLAAERATPELVAALKKIQEKCKKFDREHNYIDYSNANREFHRLIIEASDNDYIIKYMEKLLILQIYTKTIFELFPETTEFSLEDHEKIISLIKKKDGDGLQKIMLGHKKRAYNKLREHFKQIQGKI